MRKTLKDLLPNEKGVVSCLRNEEKIRTRLIEMGITPGVTIHVIQTAPLGDPLRVKVRGYELSIRKSEAAKIFISKVN